MSLDSTLTLGNTIRTTLAHWKLFAVSILLCSGLVFLGLSQMPDEYKGKLMLSSNMTDGAQIERLLMHLNDQVRQQNYNALASMLDMPAEATHHLLDIHVQNASNDINQSFFIQDIQIDNFQIDCILTVSDPNSLTALSEAILTYIRNNEFVHARASSLQQSVQEMIQLTETEIANMQANPKSSALHSASYELVLLNEKLAQYKQVLNTVKPVEMVAPVVLPNKPSTLSTSMRILLAIVLGGLIGKTIVFGYILIRGALNNDIA